MTTLREAAQQALEALERLHGGCTDSDDGTVEAITIWVPEIIDDLRAALAEPDYASANPLGGPAVVFDAIARRLRSGEPYDEVLDDYGLQHASAEPVQDHFPDVTKMVQEPVAVVRWNDIGHISWRTHLMLPDDTPLFAAPPQRQAEPVQEPVADKGVERGGRFSDAGP